MNVAGFSHANPIPAASRIGDLVFSGVITGRDPLTGELPSTLDEQCVHVFHHLRAIIEAAGGTTEDIIKLTVWLAEYRERDTLNREWLTMFPDPASRPARQVMSAELDGGMLIQCDFVGVLGGTD